MAQAINASDADVSISPLRLAGLSTAEIGQLHGFAFVATVASFLGFAAVFLLRAGMGDAPTGVCTLFVVSILPPWMCAWAVQRLAGSAYGVAGVGAGGLFIGILFPVLAFVGGRAMGIPALLFAVFAAWEGREHLGRFGRGAKTKIAAAVLISAALLLLLTAPLRFYLPEGLLFGLASPDSYYHAALAQMVSHHDAFSIGADGLGYDHYHFLSHVLAAGLSRISGLTVPQIYLYWGAISLKLNFVAAFVFSSVFLYPSGATEAPGRILWIIVYAWLAASLINAFESESFMLGLALIVAALPLWLILTTDAGPARSKTAALTVIAIVMALLCAAAKVSAGFFGGVALAVVAWHHRARPAIAALVGAGMLVLAGFAYLYVMPRSNDLAGASLFMMAASYLQYLTWQTLASYLLPLAVITILLCRPELTYSSGDGGLRFALKWDRNLRSRAASMRAWPDRIGGGVESLLAADGITQFIILSLLACVIVLCTVPIGSDIAYFSLILYGLAILLLPVALGMNSNLTMTDRPLRLVIGTLLVVNIVPLLGGFAAGIHQTLTALQHAALNISDDRPLLGRTIKESLKAHKAPLDALHEEIAASARGKLVAELDRLNHAAEGRLAVQIAPSATEMWSWLKGHHPIWCTTGHLIVPAETGIMEIRSVAPNSVERQCMPPGMFWYGYGKEQDTHRTAILSDAQLCALARPLKVKEIYRLVSYSDLRRNALVTCP